MSILRLVYSVRVFDNRLPDVTYNLAELNLWRCVLIIPRSLTHRCTYTVDSYAEITLGILCGCMPLLPKLFSNCSRRLTSGKYRLTVTVSPLRRRQQSVGTPFTAGFESGIEYIELEEHPKAPGESLNASHV